jgi:hypothetical protein
MHTMDDRLGRNVAVVIVVQCGCSGVAMCWNPFA